MGWKGRGTALKTFSEQWLLCVRENGKEFTVQPSTSFSFTLLPSCDLFSPSVQFDPLVWFCSSCWPQFHHENIHHVPKLTVTSANLRSSIIYTWSQQLSKIWTCELFPIKSGGQAYKFKPAVGRRVLYTFYEQNIFRLHHFFNFNPFTNVSILRVFNLETALTAWRQFGLIWWWCIPWQFPCCCLLQR